MFYNASHIHVFANNTRHLGGTLMEGSDTASSSLQVIVLAMTRYPEVQKKAQEEMDRVVGPDRTPNEHDLPDLKYMQAIIEEVSRNHFSIATCLIGYPVLPLPSRRDLGRSTCNGGRRRHQWSILPQGRYSFCQLL